jgi:Protein of unknown function (DUF3060)
MSSDDDPEARIRDLERSLSEQSAELTQSTAELGPAPYGGSGMPQSYTAASPYTAPITKPPYAPAQTPYPSPYPPMGMLPTAGAGRSWVGYGLLAAVLVAIVAGVVLVVAHVFSGVSPTVGAFQDTPTASGGGGPFGVPTTENGQNHAAAPSPGPSPQTEPSGVEVSVAGVDGNRTIACDDNAVNVSGVSNTVVLTGQCHSVTVSGVQNVVTVDATATIGVSGFDNRITYHTGDPQIQNSGGNNVVEQG